MARAENNYIIIKLPAKISASWILISPAADPYAHDAKDTIIKEIAICLFIFINVWNDTAAVRVGGSTTS